MDRQLTVQVQFPLPRTIITATLRANGFLHVEQDGEVRVEMLSSEEAQAVIDEAQTHPLWDAPVFNRNGLPDEARVRIELRDGEAMRVQEFWHSEYAQAPFYQRLNQSVRALSGGEWWL